MPAFLNWCLCTDVSTKAYFTLEFHLDRWAVVQVVFMIPIICSSGRAWDLGRKIFIKMMQNSLYFLQDWNLSHKYSLVTLMTNLEDRNVQLKSQFLCLRACLVALSFVSLPRRGGPIARFSRFPFAQLLQSWKLCLPSCGFQQLQCVLWLRIQNVSPWRL